MWKLREWWERHKLKRLAKYILVAEEASDRAKMNAKVILAGIEARKPICVHCFSPFDWKERDWRESFKLRAILMIPDHAPNPMICDGCFESAVSSFNPQAANIGTRNDGHTNLVLQEYSKRN